MPFLTLYWKQLAVGIVIVFLSAYIAILKYQKNSAIQELETFKLHVEKQKAEQAIQNAKASKAVAKEREVLTANYHNELQKVRDYYEANSTINANVINGLRKQSNDYRKRLSEVLKTAISPTEIGANSNPANIRQNQQAIEQACSITTLDYNALYDAWIAECNIRGCE